MSSYSQKYMTEFAYIIGTMQNKNESFIENFPTEMAEEQDGIEVFNNFVEFVVDQYMNSNTQDYEGFIKENINQFIKDYIEKREKYKNYSTPLNEYEELSSIKRTYLADFQILHAIDCAIPNLDLETKDSLRSIIKDVWLKDEEHISEAKFADDIMEAYKNKKVSLEALEKSSSREIHECCIDGNFSKLNRNSMAKNDYIAYLYEKIINSEYITDDTGLIQIEKRYLIGPVKYLTEYIKEENNFYKKNNGETENYETPIRNNEILLDILSKYKDTIIIGIEYNECQGEYDIVEDVYIIHKLEDIIEDEIEEDYEDEEEY